MLATFEELWCIDLHGVIFLSVEVLEFHRTAEFDGDHWIMNDLSSTGEKQGGMVIATVSDDE